MSCAEPVLVGFTLSVSVVDAVAAGLGVLSFSAPVTFVIFRRTCITILLSMKFAFYMSVFRRQCSLIALTINIPADRQI